MQKYHWIIYIREKEEIQGEGRNSEGVVDIAQIYEKEPKLAGRYEYKKLLIYGPAR